MQTAVLLFELVREAPPQRHASRPCPPMPLRPLRGVPQVDGELVLRQFGRRRRAHAAHRLFQRARQGFRRAGVLAQLGFRHERPRHVQLLRQWHRRPVVTVLVRRDVQDGGLHRFLGQVFIFHGAGRRLRAVVAGGPPQVLGRVVVLGPRRRADGLDNLYRQRGVSGHSLLDRVQNLRHLVHRDGMLQQLVDHRFRPRRRGRAARATAQ
mmetsp:Transcript_24316/g.61156  ORF Transcript_24316/g.61156 Transcript_24316/m.61156 type:complete len:209 (-) Transcript_24316:1524-2150(-)